MLKAKVANYNRNRRGEKWHYSQNQIVNSSNIPETVWNIIKSELKHFKDQKI